MSDCCTPIYIKIPFLSPIGEIKVQRDDSSPNSPSCGYYEKYTGSPDFSYYDYYEVDLQYNSGSGFWTFSGNATGFNDPTIYRSVITNNPCSPEGTYTGGIYGELSVYSDSQYKIYEFENSFDPYLNKGSGVHLDKDVTFTFNISDYNSRILQTSEDMARSRRFGGVIYDVLDKDGAVVAENFFSGYLSKIKISEILSLNLEVCTTISLLFSINFSCTI